MTMRGWVVSMMILSAAGAHQVRAQAVPTTVPPWAGGLDRSTLQYFYGCSPQVPSACVYAAIGTYPGATLWFLEYRPFTFDSIGRWWQTFDIWGGSTADRTCVFGNDILQFMPDDCVVQRRADLTLNAAMDYVGPEYTRIHLTLKPITTPEPGTLALLVPGLLGIGSIVRRRRTRR